MFRGHWKKLCALILAVLLFCCSCTLPELDVPDDGVWYCDTLQMSIDFSPDADVENVTLGHPDGTTSRYVFDIFPSGRIVIYDRVTLAVRLSGAALYAEDIFFIETDDLTHAFFRRGASVRA